jgi:large subunit ribosomal protein L25
MRREGKIPANIYGPNFKSVSITVESKDFNKAYKVAEETGVVYIKLDQQEIPVLIKNVQMHPVRHLILHVDFRKVDLKQKIETQVPIKVVGESPAVKDKGGVLLTQTNDVTVEALPQDIPHEVQIDVSKLAEIGSEIKVADLPKNAKYEIKDEAEKVLVSIIAHKEESLAPETVVEAPEVITEKPEEGEEAEEAAPAEEGRKPAAEGKKPSEEAKKPAQEDKATTEKTPQSQKQIKEEKK